MAGENLSNDNPEFVEHIPETTTSDPTAQGGNTQKTREVYFTPAEQKAMLTSVIEQVSAEPEAQAFMSSIGVGKLGITSRKEASEAEYRYDANRGDDGKRIVRVIVSGSEAPSKPAYGTAEEKNRTTSFWGSSLQSLAKGLIRSAADSDAKNANIMPQVRQTKLVEGLRLLSIEDGEHEVEAEKGMTAKIHALDILATCLDPLSTEELSANEGKSYLIDKLTSEGRDAVICLLVLAAQHLQEQISGNK